MTAPAADQFEEQTVRLVEDFRQFHPDRGEIVDVEEAPVIDFLRRDAPESEPIGLIVQQLVERVETARVARRAVDLLSALSRSPARTCGASWQRRSSRRLMISFSRVRSAIRSGSVSVRRGKYSSAVRMLCSSA